MRRLSVVFMLVACGATAPRGEPQRPQASTAVLPARSLVREITPRELPLGEGELRVLWSFDAGSTLFCEAQALGGNVVIATRDGYVHVLDARGAYLWSYWNGEITAPPLAQQGRLLLPGKRGLVRVLADNGALERELPLFGGGFQSPLVADENGTLYWAGEDGFVYGWARRGYVLRRRVGKVVLGPSILRPGPGVGLVNAEREWLQINGAELRRVRLSALPEAGPFVLGAGVRGWLNARQFVALEGEHRLWSAEPAYAALPLPNGNLLLSLESGLCAVGRAGACVWQAAAETHQVMFPQVVDALGQIWLLERGQRIRLLNAQGGPLGQVSVGSSVFKLSAAPEPNTVLVSMASGQVMALSSVRALLRVP